MKSNTEHCAPKHVPSEPKVIIDPESNVLFKRISCAHCGTWLSDELVTTEEGEK